MVFPKSVRSKNSESESTSLVHFSVDFRSPAKSLTFSGPIAKPIRWQKVKVLPSKQHAPKICVLSFTCTLYFPSGRGRSKQKSKSPAQPCRRDAPPGAEAWRPAARSRRGSPCSSNGESGGPKLFLWELRYMGCGAPFWMGLKGNQKETTYLEGPQFFRNTHMAVSCRRMWTSKRVSLPFGFLLDAPPKK